MDPHEIKAKPAVTLRRAARLQEQKAQHAFCSNGEAAGTDDGASWGSELAGTASFPFRQIIFLWRFSFWFFCDCSCLHIPNS